MLRSTASLLLLAAALSFPTVAAAQPSPDRTALQNHVDFFDRDGNGFIRVMETAKGLVAIGFPGGWGSAWVTANAIHAGLSKTHGGGSWWRPTTIDTSIIHKGVHGSDTGAYDEDGNFVHAKYLAIFQYDEDGNDAIDTKELKAFHKGNDTADGAAASRAEFVALLLVAGEKNETTGRTELTRDTLRSLYDGSLFYELEAKETARKQAAARARAKAIEDAKRAVIDVKDSILGRLGRLWPF